MVNGLPISRFAKPFHEAATWFAKSGFTAGMGRNRQGGMASAHADPMSSPVSKVHPIMKMKTLVFAFTVPFASLLSVPAWGADVTLLIKGADAGGANVMASICTQAEFLKRCELRQKMSATEKTVTLLFKDVSPGTYAASAFQDINDDARLGRGAFGAPNEPWAVSNNAKGMMGPPAFDDAKFEVGEKPLTLQLSLD